MIIEINNDMTIGEVSDAFAGAFPFLQIAFFTEPHDWGKASSASQKIAPGKKIGLLRNTVFPGVMEIHSWHTTGLVEQEFGKIFGLYIQVFRREGMAWIQTAGTDNRTLEEQNEAARNASQELLDGTDERFNKENPV